MIGQSRTYLSTRLISHAIRIREKELNLFHESLTESGLGLGAAFICECAFEVLIEYGSAGREWPHAAIGKTWQSVFVVLMVMTICIAINCVV
eukprot:CAMPEP_0119520838 /NCGR_PEP_ID=MMETSP1344-20130328/36740_1 /TAXON_ID=236787 /ORGANISM="Florenciella parvula, Strain CCMP2471" /LENGTH=91 /DNA_ID=CAMNT_0007558763 /DNA_START=93 /DNA_END=364 /DNA_ORIENTATION=+